MWFEFKKWGDVREVFIAKNRNRSDWRYGFVRFKGVGDVGKLEWQLDNLIVGGLKLHVNLSNLAVFDRLEDELVWDREDITPKYIGDDMVLLVGLTDTRAKAMHEYRWEWNVPIPYAGEVESELVDWLQIGLHPLLGNPITHMGPGEH